MSDESTKLDLLLNDIEEKCDPADYAENSARFQIECLSLIAERMPTIAATSYAVARAHVSGQSNTKAVAEALKASWDYLDVGCKSLNLSDVKVSATRAVICALHEQLHQEDTDFVDSMSFFLRLVNNVEPHFEAEEMLLRKYFGACL
jgi:hypothetical protein